LIKAEVASMRATIAEYQAKTQVQMRVIRHQALTPAAGRGGCIKSEVVGQDCSINGKKL
jgi:hypothetical protein